jgi:hypothetical protein
MKYAAFQREKQRLYSMSKKNAVSVLVELTLSNPIFLPPAYSPALIYLWQERGWWITCNYPTVLKEKNREYNLRYLLAKVLTT